MRRVAGLAAQKVRFADETSVAGSEFAFRVLRLGTQ